MMGALALTLAGGCKKKEDPAPAVAPAAAASGEPGAAARPAASPAPKADLGIFPRDTLMVFGLNLKKWQGSKLYESLIKANLEKNVDVQRIAKVCGMDVLGQIDSFVVGTSDLDEDDQVAILVIGRLEEAKVNRCMEAVAKEEGTKISIEKDGPLTVYREQGDDDPGYAAWVSGGVLLGENPEHVKRVASRASSLRDNAELMNLVAKVDTGANLWMAALVPKGEGGESFDMFGGGPKPRGAYLSLQYDKSLDARLVTLFDSPGDAQRAASEANRQIAAMKNQPGPLGQLFSGIKVSASAAEAHFSIQLSEPQLDQLVAAFGAQLGAAFGAGK